MPAGDVVLTAVCASDFHTLAVNGGSGSGSYRTGTAVSITADPPQAHMTFDRWTGADPYVQSITSATTTVTLPACDISVTATYIRADAAPSTDFTYTTNNGTITLTGYVGDGGVVIIPSAINSLPVTSIGSRAFSSCTNVTHVTIPDNVISIGDNAFYYCSRLTSLDLGHGICDIGNWAFNCCPFKYITIPSSVTNIGGGAFYKCGYLRGVFFESHAPSLGARGFGVTDVTVYYLPETSGWGTTFGDRQTLLWNPHVLPDADIGFIENRFRFTIAGTTNIPIWWRPAQTSPLTSGCRSKPIPSARPARFSSATQPPPTAPRAFTALSGLEHEARRQAGALTAEAPALHSR
jgi:hypothetical protein